MTAIWSPADEANFAYGRAGTVVDRIVMHWTTGSLNSTIAHFQNPAAQVAAHYVIDRDGLLYQCVLDQNTAYHAGDYSMNQRSIGIEHVGGPQYDGFTDAQYRTSSDLIRDLSERYGFAANDTYVIPHRSVVPTQCPGVLDIARIITAAQEDDMTPAQMQELKDFITAQVTVIVAAGADMERRSMRGGDPAVGYGAEPVIAAGEQINPSNGKG